MSDHEKNFFDNILESVIAVDKEDKIREVNEATLKLLGYKKKEELITLPFEKICKNFSLSGLRGKIPLLEQELIYLTCDGTEIPVSANIVRRMSYPDDIIFVARDISKIKELITTITKSREELDTSYRQLQDSKDELIRSEKLAYVGRIAAGIAHEIKNPLTNVTMSLQQFEKTIKLGNSQAGHIGIIKRNLQRINYLIVELLNCARPAKLDLRPYDIRVIIKNILESTRAKSRVQRIKVVKIFKNPPHKIEVDREQIERALLNIVLNAIEAMPRGGKLTISIKPNENFLMIKIQDTGKGIPEENLIRVFDPFFSTKPQGVGLGLTLCYGIIVGHGGTIGVESNVRHGTIFTVSLPMRQELRKNLTFRLK